MPRKVLVFSECCSENLGDQAIAKGLQKCLGPNDFELDFVHLERGRSCQLCQVAPLLESPKTGLSIRAILAKFPLLSRLVSGIYLAYWAPRYLFRLFLIKSKFEEADVVLIGGGSLLMNNKMHFPIALTLVSKFCRFQKVPMGFAGISTGNELTYPPRALFRIAFRHASFCFCRDSNTVAYIRQQLGYDRPEIGPDFALFAFQRPRSHKEGVASTVAMSVAANSSGEADGHYNAILTNLERLATSIPSQTRLIIFTTGCAEDLSVAQSIYAKALKVRGNVTLEIPSTLTELASLVQSASITVNMRLHASIISAALGVPYLAAPVSTKVLAYFQTVGQQTSVLEQLGQPDCDLASTLARLQQLSHDEALLIAQQAQNDQLTHIVETMLQVCQAEHSL